MMRKVSQDEIHRVRMCNARIRNQNHLLRCTLRNISTNPYSECDRVVSSVINHCTKKKCEAKSGEPDSCLCCTCCPGTDCTNQQIARSSSPQLCNRIASSPTYTSCGTGMCSKPYCTCCRTTGPSYPYSKFYNRTNSSTVSQPHIKPCLIQRSPEKPRCRSAGSDEITCKSATSCNKSAPNEHRSSSQRQHPGVAPVCKHHGCLVSTTTEPLAQTCYTSCCCCCCCHGTTCKSSPGRNKCSHHKPGVERSVSGCNKCSHLNHGVERSASGCNKCSHLNHGVERSASCCNKCSHHKPGVQRSMSGSNNEREQSPQNAKAYQTPASDRHDDGGTMDKTRAACSTKCQHGSCPSQSLPSSCSANSVCPCHNHTNNKKDRLKPNPILPAAHDSSLDDAELVRRCERRVMMFPHYKPDFSLLSADTTQSSALPASSISQLEGSGETLSADSYHSSTMSSTNRHDWTVFENTSVNRNPYQDGRRWAGEGDCCCPTHHTHRHPSTSAGTRPRSCLLSSKATETGQEQSCLASSDNDCGKDNERTDNPSNSSSDSLPIIDNLILEPQTDFKNTAAAKGKQWRHSARCTQLDPQRAIIYAWRGSSSHSCENKKHKQKTTLSKQLTGSKSNPLGKSNMDPLGKSNIDPSSEIYLKRLDNILGKMCTKRDKPHTRPSEKSGLIATDTVPGCVNKVLKISPTRQVCPCSHKCGANNKLSIHDMVDEMKRVGQLRSRPGTKIDTVKQEKVLSTARPAPRDRCPHKSDRKQLDSQEASTSTCKVQTRQHSLPTNSHKSISGHGRTRSKSLSALPRCHTQPLTSTTCTHRSSGKVHSCGATASCSRGSVKLNSITQQQQEILKHIPKDFTPDEIGALMKTVLSIVERRYSLKEPDRDGGGGQDGQQDGRNTVLEDLSKYDVRGQSDSCNTQIALSSKPKIHYSYKTVDDMSNQDLLQTTASSQSSRDELLVPSKDVGSRIKNTSKNFGSLYGKYLSSGSEFASCSIPGQVKGDVRKDFLPVTSLRYSDSSSSDYSSRTYNLSIGALEIPARSHKSKQSAVVLPFDDTIFPQQSRAEEPESGDTCTGHLLAPHTSPANDRPPETKRNLNSIHVGNPDSSRHIGWKCPLQTDRSNSLPVADACLEDGNTWLPTENENNVVRSDSALSDGLLYVRSASRTHPHSSCPSHVALPGDRRLEYGQGFHQREGRKSSSTSLINGTDGAVEVSLALPPCPHEHNHNECGKGDGLTKQNQYTVLKDAELDRKINDLRLQIQRSYRMPWSRTLQHDAFERSGETSPQTQTSFERQNTSIQSEAGEDRNCPGDSTDLDALSCSVDTELTNTSISNRLQELDGEFSSSPGNTWPSNASVVSNENMSQVPYLPGQCSLHRKHKCTTYTNGDREPERGGANRFSGLTTDHLHQPSKMWRHGEGLQTVTDTYKWHRNTCAAEPEHIGFDPTREPGHLVSDPRTPKLTSLNQVDLDSINIHFTGQDTLARTGSVRDLAESELFGRQKVTTLQECRAAGPGFRSWTFENLESFNREDTTRQIRSVSRAQLPACQTSENSFQMPNLIPLPASLEHHGSSKPTNNIEQTGMLKLTNNIEQAGMLKLTNNIEQAGMLKLTNNIEQAGMLKLTNNIEQAGMLKLTNNIEQAGMLKLTNNIEQAGMLKLTNNIEQAGMLKLTNNIEQAGMLKPSIDSQQPCSFRHYESLEASDVMNVATRVEQTNNLKSFTGIKATNTVGPAGSIGPPDNLNLDNNVQSPTNRQQISNTANKLQMPAQCGHTSPVPQSNQQCQGNDTPTAAYTRNPKVKSTAISSSLRKTNLAQLKQHTKSLLVEVCRRYCTDTLVPSLATSGNTDLDHALEFIQNFSPISQVDVNTQYPVTVSAREQLLSAETTNKQHTSTSQSQQVTSQQVTSQQVTSQVVVTKGRSNGLSKGPSNNKNSFSGNKVQKSLLKTNFRQAKKISRTVVSCRRIVKTVAKGKDRFASQRPNHNNTGAGLREMSSTQYVREKAERSQIQCDSLHVQDTTQPQIHFDCHTIGETAIMSQLPRDSNTVHETAIKSHLPYDNRTVCETTGKTRRRAKKKSTHASLDTVVVDVTSPQTIDRCSIEGEDIPPKVVSSSSIIMKKYSCTSAMPVEIEEISCSLRDSSVSHTEPAQNSLRDSSVSHTEPAKNSLRDSSVSHTEPAQNSLRDSSVSHTEPAQKRSAKRPTVTFESHSAPCIPGKINGNNNEHSQNNENTSCRETQSADLSQACTIARLASAAAVARKMLASRVKPPGRVLSLGDYSFTSDSFLETTTDSELSLQDIQIEETRQYDFTNCDSIADNYNNYNYNSSGNYNNYNSANNYNNYNNTDNNNNSNSYTPAGRGLRLVDSSIPPSLLLITLQVQICMWRQILHPRLMQLLVSYGMMPEILIDVLSTSLAESPDDNECSAASRPCTKILGELAFQLERRILDYVFGMEGYKRRRFYGYTVNNICQMMNKESKNVCGSEDPLRKSELAFRLQKLLTGLKKVGYNIKMHGDFAQKIVNTYGLLPCPPDCCTIRDFGLHNANCIANLINHLACDDSERENLHILLKSLKYLSKCDSRPLFVW